MRHASLLAVGLLLAGCQSSGSSPSGGGGSSGTAGGAGTTGAAGTTGGAGTTGVAGTTGAAGTMGASGTTGGAGTTGVAGTTGAAGTMGVAGTTGSGGGAGTTGTAGGGGTGGGGGAAAGGRGGTAGGGAGGAAAGGAGGPGGTGGRGGAGAGGASGAGGSTSGGAGGRGGGGGVGGANTDGGVDRMDAQTSDAAMPYNPCPATGVCSIMPLGDSITYGVGSSGSGGGYRVELFRQSVASSELITFVGRNMNGPTTVAGKPFPMSHEGYSGYTIDPDSTDGRSGISPLVDAALSMFHPKIVLLMIGTNDVNLSYQLTTAPTRLGALLDRITTDEPNALLVVAKLTPTTTDSTNTRVQTYNNAIPGLVQTRVAAGKHIALVDMYAAFTANTSYKTALMNDDLHPNDTGYVLMAQTWYAAIKAFLPAQ